MFQKSSRYFLLLHKIFRQHPRDSGGGLASRRRMFVGLMDGRVDVRRFPKITRATWEKVHFFYKFNSNLGRRVLGVAL